MKVSTKPVVMRRMSTENNFSIIEINCKGKIQFFVTELGFFPLMALSLPLVWFIPE